jgi:ATP-binding cassette subfamily B protein
MNQNFPSNIWVFLWRYASFCPKGLLALSAIIFLVGFIPTLDSFLMKKILDSAANLQNQSANIIKSEMLVWILAYPILWESINLLWRLYDYIYLSIMPAMQAKVSEDLFHYSHHHSHKFFQENLAGSIANRISEATRSIEHVFIKGLECILRRFATVASALYAMFLVHSIFGFIMMIWLFCFIFVNVFFYENIIKHTKKFAKSRVTGLGRIVDTIHNIYSVRMFARHDHEKNYIKKYFDDTKSSNQDLQWFMLKIKYLQGFSCTILIFFMAYYLVHLYSKSLVTVGDFGLILSLSLAIANDIIDLSQELGLFYEELGICNQALSLITPHQIQNLKNAEKKILEKGKIEFKNVSFQYLHNQNIFQNVSITIPEKQKVGLVGYSGSGKTTFVNLIARLFEIESGEILLDDMNIRNYTLESLNNNLTFIPQSPSLFHRSVRENIKYGKLDATDEEMFEAARLAHIHDNIMNMSEGYDTICGELGGNLSGGQRQRIIIARAILKNSKVLILDEATSALDSVHEKLIQDSLEYLMNNKTVLVVAHRLSTLVKMDRILVFDEGHIVEDGTHSELIKKQGLYFNLWQSQHSRFIINESEPDEK